MIQKVTNLCLPGNAVEGLQLSLSVFFNSVLLQQLQINKFSYTQMAAFQDDFWCHICLLCLYPASHAQTPPVSGFKPWELKFRNRSRQVVTSFSTELQELIGHHYTDCMHPPVISAGVAKTITKKPCHGIF